MPPGRDSESRAEFSFLSTNHLEGDPKIPAMHH